MINHLTVCYCATWYNELGRGVEVIRSPAMVWNGSTSGLGLFASQVRDVCIIDCVIYKQLGLIKCTKVTVWCSARATRGGEMLFCAGVFCWCGVGVIVAFVVVCCCIQLCRGVDGHNRRGNTLSKHPKVHFGCGEHGGGE